MGWAIQGLGGGENVVGYQIVGDGGSSKGIAIKRKKKERKKKSKKGNREAGVGTHLGGREGVKREVVNLYRCRTMGK
jgi:hypothetical protein